MKQTMIRLLALALFAGATACSDDDAITPPDAVRHTFTGMFPRAVDVEWERRASYLVAEFDDAGSDTEAWFDNAGKWYMTETESSYTALPEAVRTAFETSDYASWRVDDVERILHHVRGTLHALDVERGAQEYELYYTDDGTLWQAVPDIDGLRDELLP